MGVGSRGRFRAWESPGGAPLAGGALYDRTPYLSKGVGKDQGLSRLWVALSRYQQSWQPSVVQHGRVWQPGQDATAIRAQARFTLRRLLPRHDTPASYLWSMPNLFDFGAAKFPSTTVIPR